MRKFICIFSLFFFALALQGQQRTPQTKVEVSTQKLVPIWKIMNNLNTETSAFARLYRRPNTRVKKALSFTTRWNRPKMA